MTMLTDAILVDRVVAGFEGDFEELYKRHAGTAWRVAQAVTGNADARQPTGTGATASTMRDVMASVRTDFAEANQYVFYGMAIALAVGFLCALRHPGGRGGTAAPDDPPPAG